MLAENRPCPDCGVELTSGLSAAPLCARCLLSLALDVTELEPETLVDGEAPTVAAPEEPFARGEVQGERYRIHSLLGRGGMGEVWRAYDLKLRQDVALKSLKTEQVSDTGALEMLRQEVRVAREVISPNVCRVFDLHEVDGRELVSMEYIDGTTLAEILEERSPLELDEAREIASQFLAGLEAVHDAGLVHRDIKPENIMITRTGRVVVMDFGIAKGLGTGRGELAGTPAYMSPEQRRGEELDARADLFSAGVVLAEMVAADGVRTFEARRALWERIHQGDANLLETPWGAVVTSAISPDRDQRYATAGQLARALDEVTLRALGDETAQPYPGLAAFQQEDARFFFGRELEVEGLWKKLRRPHLFAVIGPSGAGKSSFLRAGLLPTLDEEWRVIVATPGHRPFASLAEQLSEEQSGALGGVAPGGPAGAVEEVVTAVSRWRDGAAHGLVIVDQFEELFTQCAPEVQQEFTQLLGRLPIETDTHVLVSMRDDFLFHCHRFEALRPILTDLTLLGPPTGASLRRAIVEPALRCGYRFEDEAIVEEMLSEVEGERGALPMVAFAAARLWEERDRDSGLLGREAYGRIGGVGGALAQHAERTLERIGEGGVPIVRELFRNLVTAQGTRASRDREELLSVFEGAGSSPHPTARSPEPAADSVLDALVDARLLTAYEVAGDGDAAASRVEIVHESLLSHWPRLVQWRTQDAGGALLRDQLRQAAQMWIDRDRPDDLLWAGRSLREYQLWREDYPGGLSAAEEEFAAAMIARAEQGRRRKRRLLAAVVAILAIGLGVVGALWRQAEAETRRAEASKLLALAQLEVERFPTGALAYVMRSLDLADSPAGRRAALGILQRAPVAQILPGTSGYGMSFSPDGAWLGISNWLEEGPVQLFSADGRRIRVPAEPAKGRLRFSPDGELLIRTTGGVRAGRLAIERWTLPHLSVLPTLELTGRFLFGRPVGGAFHLHEMVEFPREVFDIHRWPADAMQDEALKLELRGRLSDWPIANWTDPTGRWIVGLERGETVRADRLLLRPFTFEGTERVRDLRLPWVGARQNFEFSPDGEWLAAQDSASDEIALWDLADESLEPFMTLAGSRSPDPLSYPTFSDDRSRLVMVSSAEDDVYMWDLGVPLDGRPTAMTVNALGGSWLGRFHPGGRWLATLHGGAVAFWPVDWPVVRVVSPRDDPGFNWIGSQAFSPDSRWIGSCSNTSGLHLWPLQAGLGPDYKVANRCVGVTFHPEGTHVVTGRRTMALTPIGSSEPELTADLETPRMMALAPAVDGEGRFVAAYFMEVGLMVWDLATGAHRKLSEGGACGSQESSIAGPCHVGTMGFSADGSLWTGGGGGVRRWDVSSGRSEWRTGPKSGAYGAVDLSADGRFLVTQLERPVESTGSSEGASQVVMGSGAYWTDLDTGLERRIEGLEAMTGPIALSPSGNALAVTTSDGDVWLRRVEGGEPHLLISGEVSSLLEFSPDGRWIAGIAGEEIWIWPVPDLARPPFHLLPLEEALAKLRALTNVRAVEDPEASSGWKLEFGPFPGWQDVPEW